ncbi:ras GEF [Sarocladium strictum]
MESFNIAVIGATGVGKSSFVQRVLGLQRPSMSNTSSVRMAVDNLTHFVTLLELDLEYFELSPSQPIQWPKQMNGHIVPRVDAALILYDVMEKESIRDLPQTVAALTNSGLPAILVACKCENPEDDWEVDAEGMANHKFFKACIGTYQITKDENETARACLQAILKAAIANRREEHGESVSRRRAQSAAHAEPHEGTGGRSYPDQSKHSRASSDLSLLRGFPNAPVKDGYRGQAGRSPRLMHQSLATDGIRLDRAGADSFLDMEESDAESHRYSDDTPILQRNDESPEKPSKENGVTFDALVDRLLAPRLSKPDNNFSEVFLCLYRKFAAPGKLFSAILERLDRVREDKTAHYLSKTANQLRMIEVIAKWVSLYPGDFARPATRRNLEEFIRHLSTEPIFSIAAQQMRRNLHYNVIEDDDTGWANSDETGDKVASQLLSKEMSELAVGISTMQFDDEHNGRPSASSDASQLDRGSSVSSQFHFHTYDEYEREASSLEPRDHLPMNKTRYHIFMDIPNDDIADELTRIDWIMFSSIRIRDFVRHVSLSASQKEKCKSLKNVNRMIAHFNHIAKWVANMILLRDKPKHRAQMLEKFMHIAVKLRQLNNYNGLAAIVAGINGTAIHRLAQTRALVPEGVTNRFTRLCILMGTQKSHFAYRLAWENSPLPRIPFIPLHRRDLVSAEEGSKTFVGSKGDRINWKKFEVLGEVLLPVMKSQGAAYPNLARHDNARELILGCRMPTDDEDIYQRSVQVESGASGAGDLVRKKTFPWFATK